MPKGWDIHLPWPQFLRLFRSVLFARGSDASRAQNQWLGWGIFGVFHCHAISFATAHHAHLGSDLLPATLELPNNVRRRPREQMVGEVPQTIFGRSGPDLRKFHKSRPSQTRRFSRGHTLRIAQHTVQWLLCGLTKFGLRDFSLKIPMSKDSGAMAAPDGIVNFWFSSKRSGMKMLGGSPTFQRRWEHASASRYPWVALGAARVQWSEQRISVRPIWKTD
jgi:hypothetical protein